MKRGTFMIHGVGQSTLDLDKLTIPLSGEIRLDGVVRGILLSVSIPNSLVHPLMEAIDHPMEQIPMFRPELLLLSILPA